jgi:hypothetical protein
VTIENLTYAALAERLKISPEAARALVKRMHLPRQRANDGKTLVSVDLSEIQHKPMPARSSRGDQAATGTVAILTARIEVLQTQLVMLEESSRGHREDYVRECERADRLVTDLVKMTSDMMEAKETAAKLEGELAALRSTPKRETLTWWRWRRTG